MKKLEYTVEFVTPAFLGNAEQTAQWRTPPFKTMLRQWWRVLNSNLSVSELLKKEGELFGVALNDVGSQSKIRLRLSDWGSGKLRDWKPLDKINHPEVGNIEASIYLGYGPIAKGSKLKSNAAIQANEKSIFTLISEDSAELELKNIMQLAHWFGTLGGRSRNGWGSAQFSSKEYTLIHFDEIQSAPLLKKISMPLADCMSFEYPTALGTDEKGALIWKAKTPCDDWAAAMKELAKIKIALRTSFSFSGHSGGLPMRDRHVLSYPVTKHETKDYEKGARLPNQLRFKVIKTTAGKYLPVAFHFPVKTPMVVLANNGLAFDEKKQLAVWKKAHSKMDELMMRISK